MLKLYTSSSAAHRRRPATLKVMQPGNIFCTRQHYQPTRQAFTKIQS